MPDAERPRRARPRRPARAGRPSLGSGRIFLGPGRHRRAEATPHQSDQYESDQHESAQHESAQHEPAREEALRRTSPRRASGRRRAARPSAKPKAAASEEERPAGGDATTSARHRLAQALSNPGRGQILVAVLLLVFGLGVTMQVRTLAEDSTYSNARRQDLIQILDGLTQENHRLENELSDLQKTRDQLKSGTDAQAVARTEAEQRISMLSILAGTVPAEGPGIRMVISDPQHKVTPEILLDAIEEMRDAGGEVIEINNSVRLVASSWFGSDDSGGLVVDGKSVTRPITIEIIGDPHNLEEGANFRGGIVSEITSSRVGGDVVITQLDRVDITSLHTQKERQYARPATPQPTS